MRVLVCGGRKNEAAAIIACLDARHKQNAISTVINCCNKTVGLLIEEWCWKNEVEQVVACLSNFFIGNFAGPLHKQNIIDETKPDFLMIFHGRSAHAWARHARAVEIDFMKIGFSEPENDEREEQRTRRLSIGLAIGQAYQGHDLYSVGAALKAERRMARRRKQHRLIARRLRKGD